MQLQTNSSDLKFCVSVGLVAGTCLGLYSAKQFAPRNAKKQTMDTIQKLAETTTCVSVSMICGTALGCLIYTKFLAKERRNHYANFQPLSPRKIDSE
jgi:hypothetical protein